MVEELIKQNQRNYLANLDNRLNIMLNDSPNCEDIENNIFSIYFDIGKDKIYEGIKNFSDMIEDGLPKREIVEVLTELETYEAIKKTYENLECKKMMDDFSKIAKEYISKIYMDAKTSDIKTINDKLVFDQKFKDEQEIFEFGRKLGLDDDKAAKYLTPKDMQTYFGIISKDESVSKEYKEEFKEKMTVISKKFNKIFTEHFNNINFEDMQGMWNNNLI